MGNDSLVLWLSAELALGYFVAVAVGMLGLLQWVAVQRNDLRWLPVAWQRPVALLLIGAALLLFYVRFYDLIFVPGPAGLELILLFGAATALATWLTHALAALRRRRSGA